MEIMDAIIGASAGGALGVGVFVGATRATLNAIKESLGKIEAALEKLNGTVDHHGERLSVLEAVRKIT